MIIFDEDLDFRFYQVEAGTMTEDKLFPIVDNLEKTQTGILIVGVNAQKANFKSKYLQDFTDGFDIRLGVDQPWMMGFTDDAWLFRRSANISVLEAHGIDSNQVLIDRARQKGMKAWVSVRMNDSHGLWLDKSPMMSDLWYKRPDLRIKNVYPQPPFDYAQKEIRDLYTSFIGEVLEKYEPDGINVEWMRHPPFFSYNEGEQNIHYLTEVMENVHKLVVQTASRLGHKIEIAASVPSSLKFARQYGIDAVDWANRNLVDRLILAPKLMLDVSIDPRSWRKELDNPNFPLTVRIENSWHLYPDCETNSGDLPEVNNTPENHLAIDRGAAWTALNRGSNSISFFNHMRMRNNKAACTLFSECGDLATLRGKPRWYLIAYNDLDMDDWTFFKGWRKDGYFKIWREECEANGTYPYALPRTVKPGMAESFKFDNGPIPEQNAKISIKFAGVPRDAAVYIQEIMCVFNDGAWQPTQSIQSKDDLTVTVTNSTEKDCRITAAVLKIDF